MKELTQEEKEQENSLTEIIKKQIDINEDNKNPYALNSEKLDLKLQLEKGRNLMDMKRIATCYFEDGKMYITSSIVYSNSLGLFAKIILKKKVEKAQLVEDINEIIYPNGDSAPLLVFDEKNVKSIRIKNSVNDSLKKLVIDFQDSLDMLEKRYLAKRFADLYTDKWSIGIVFVIGGIFGYAISKTTHF